MEDYKSILPADGINTYSAARSLELHWPPVAEITCRSVLRVVRELMAADAGDVLFTAVQKWAYANDQGDYGTFIRRVKKLDRKHYPRMIQVLSNGQIESKLWLIEMLKTVLPQRPYNYYLLGGWYGMLGLMMMWLMPGHFRRMWSFDIDPECEKVMDMIARQHLWAENWEMRPITFDMYDLPLGAPDGLDPGFCSALSIPTEGPDVIINTSCEHLERFSSWYEGVPKGKIIVLQSNNFFEWNEHVNCVASLDAFKASAPMGTVLYEGSMNLQDYDRFMLIGIR
ncbi:MAG: hypothetical protein H6624_17680 [Bdellovibrionaceae bacterium]|nr:hypothetical protein [Bdellovibrionales bacterium]MCB9086176.1 hypothetical protein [Pseudobdellovibrionaceae bacterium]